MAIEKAKQAINDLIQELEHVHDELANGEHFHNEDTVLAAIEELESQSGTIETIINDFREPE